LFTELEAIRQQGYAVNDEQKIAGIRTVSAPIQDARNVATANIRLSEQTRWLSVELYHETLPELVM
jgi:DNA-binding IclR family transcriptional regulator